MEINEVIVLKPKEIGGNICFNWMWHCIISGKLFVYVSRDKRKYPLLEHLELLNQ